MMDSPEFKKQMKLMEKSKEFKEAKKKAQQMMDDPSSAARLEAQVEHMVQRGQDTLVKNAYNSMSDAMSSLSDPDMMAEAVEMMKDPAFRQQLNSMASDPSFKTYLKAVSSLILVHHALRLNFYTCRRSCLHHVLLIDARDDEKSRDAIEN